MIRLYSFDTSSLMAARIRMYPPDLFPSVWAKFEELVNVGRILVPDEVFTELTKKDDDVSKWAKQRTAMIVPLAPDVTAAMTDILSRHPMLMAKGSRRNGADPWVIAVAKVRNAAVVTEEGSGGKRTKIPDVCHAEKVECLSVLGVIRLEGWTF